jgi:hypothetical protein
MMNKELVRTIRDDVNAALAEVGRKHGLSIHAGNATFDNNAATFKLVCSTVADGGRLMTPQASAYERVAGFYGFVPLFSTIHIGADEYTVVGYNSRKRSNPVLVERNGLQYAVSDSLVTRKPETVG